MAPPEGWLGIAYVTVRPDAPAESGEGFKRSWSEAKEEAGWTEDGQGSGKRAGVVPQLMAMAQGGMEEKWNTAQDFAESGEGFKRSWSEAKEEAGWTEDG